MPKFSKCCPKRIRSNFYSKTNVFQNSPMSHLSFGLFLQEILSPKTFKIAQSGHTGKHLFSHLRLWKLKKELGTLWRLNYLLWLDRFLVFSSVTRLGDFLDVGQLFKAKSLTFLGNFCKCVKVIHFSCEIIFGNFYRHLAIFFLPHWCSVESLK